MKYSIAIKINDELKNKIDQAVKGLSEHFETSDFERSITVKWGQNNTDINSDNILVESIVRSIANTVSPFSINLSEVKATIAFFGISVKSEELLELNQKMENSLGMFNDPREKKNLIYDPCIWVAKMSDNISNREIKSGLRKVTSGLDLPQAFNVSEINLFIFDQGTGKYNAPIPIQLCGQ